jgi:hypothetical protein
VPVGNVPPFDRAIATHAGVVIFTGTDGEFADPITVSTFYFPVWQSEEHVWASLRPGSLEELVTTWPARTPAEEEDLFRGWWLPDGRIAGRAAKGQKTAPNSARKKSRIWKVMCGMRSVWMGRRS